MTRFIMAAACFAGSTCAFTLRFFEMLPFKSVVPFVAQMLWGWCLLFAGVYYLVQGVRQVIASAKEGVAPMDSSNAEQMTEAEAEAALLALGDPLAWRTSPDVKTRGYESASYKGGSYWISGESLEWKAYTMPSPDPSSNIPAWRASVNPAPRRYTSSADAKLACERHHATGLWE